MAYDRSADPFEQDLEANKANFVPLSPLSFLKRTAAIHPERTAIVHDEIRFSYDTFFQRCRQFASALHGLGIGRGDTVAIMAPNIPAMIEAHYGVPATGAVLNPLNFRLDPDTLAFILRHGGCKVLFADSEYVPVIRKTLEKLERPPVVVDILDPMGPSRERVGDVDYETLLARASADFAWEPPESEWQAMALSYTSGTTGDPKGVVYHYRGAYINALSNVAAWQLPLHPVYLWTLPIFHSLGWCFPWTVTLMAGTQVCLRRVEAQAMFQAIDAHRVTHLCGAPVVLNMMINAPAGVARSSSHTVDIMTAASPPPASVIARIEALGFRILHVYGLTEVFGPAVICEWQQAWDDLPRDRQAALKARQGVAYPTIEEIAVAHPETLEPVPRDAQTMGEVLVRGNTIMRGYLKNPKATAAAFAHGWFHTGDLAVWHADGYIELKDRSKDIIISGGENISTIEVEGVLYQHPAILEVAVVGRPDDHWGEVPCAFITLKEGAKVEPDELTRFCRERLAHYKVPKAYVLGPLPKTSTGKVQKFLLRARARENP